jgi:predicted CXXCH cytochrome family protein
MKHLLIAVLLVVFAAAPALAAPDTVTIPAKNGNVTFSHKGHADAMDCAVCHGADTSAKLIPMGKDPGHKLCMDCHKEKGAGPVKCGECHKK